MGVKSHRAKGKRLTTYDVAALRMIESELPPEPEQTDEEGVDGDQLTDASGNVPQDSVAEVKTTESAAPKANPAAKPAPEKASADHSPAGTIVGDVEFEIERAKGDADEVIDPEQLNLF